MVERLILVKDCRDCPIKERKKGEWICRQSGKPLGTTISELSGIPASCPLMPADQGGGKK